jgi:hypothetical protein
LNLVTPDVLRAAQKELRQISGIRQRLRALAEHLAVLTRQGGPDAERVELATADLQCLLTDHLEPAVVGLERLCAGLEVDPRAAKRDETR